MKRWNVILGLVLSAGLFSCGNKENSPNYDVKFNINEWETGVVYLENRNDKGWVRFDSLDLSSAQKVDGFYSMKGNVEVPHFCRIVNADLNKANVGFFIENSNIEITGTVTDNTVKGSASDKEFKEIQAQEIATRKKINEIYQTYQSAKTEEEKKRIETQLDSISNSTQVMKKEYVKSHPKSAVSPYLVSTFFYELTWQEIDAYLKPFDKSLKASPSYQFLSARIEKLKTVDIGKTAPDFTMSSPEGKDISLSSVYKQNEYTLIDFWASWCSPCRKENPNVVKAFEKYGSKGFGVFGVSLDNRKQRWEEAIAKDKLTWPHVSDLKGWSNSAAMLYAVNSIPANLLVDKNGKIVAKNLKEEALHEKLEELLK